MDINKLKILRENFAWIERETADTAALCEGAINELVNSTSTDALPSPVEALELYRSLEQSQFNHKTFVKLCMELLNRDRLTEEDEDSFVPKSVEYLRSGVADKAFEHFAKRFERLAASYVSDFKTMCEDVYYDRADACILPIESSTDGMLASFRHLLIKYELKLSGICKVKQNDETTLTLALVTGSLIPLNGDIYELYFPSITGNDACDILSMISELSGDIIKINSSPCETDGLSDFHICAKLSQGGARALIYSFEALYPTHILLGNY